MAWPPTDAPTGGKDNLTRQLNDHPNEHNVIAAWCADAYGQIDTNRTDVATKAAQSDLDALDSRVKVPQLIGGGGDATGYGTWNAYLIGGVVQIAVARQGSTGNIGTLSEYRPGSEGGDVYGIGAAVTSAGVALGESFILRVRPNGVIFAAHVPASADWCYAVVQYIPNVHYPSSADIPPP